MTRGLEQAERLVKTMTQVKTLDRLTGRALDQVVLGAQQNDPARAIVHRPADIDKVGAYHIFGIWTPPLAEQPDESG